jgi:DNA-binding MarR family transcriptional regulator
MDFPSKYKRSFTPKLAWDFASLMEKQTAPVYEQFGLTIPVITSSTLCLIAEYKKASLLEVASALKISHQLAAQRVKTLLQLGIISTEKDQSDKRRTYYSLTAKGRKKNKLLNGYLIKAERAVLALNQELGIYLMQLLVKVNQSFSKLSLYQRISGEEEY